MQLANFKSLDGTPVMWSLVYPKLFDINLDMDLNLRFVTYCTFNSSLILIIYVWLVVEAKGS